MVSAATVHCEAFSFCKQYVVAYFNAANVVFQAWTFVLTELI